jgi:hypothetical protein
MSNNLMLSVFSFITISFASAVASPLKIYTINSYSEDFPWTSIILKSYFKQLEKKGINVSVKSHFFNVKKHPRPLDIENKELVEIVKNIENWKPDFFLLTDDYAVHQMSRYLSTKKIPFVFTGLNGEIPGPIIKSHFKKYSGVFERYYLLDTLKLLKKLINKTSVNVLILLEESETSTFVKESFLKQVKTDSTIKFKIVQSNSFDLWKKLILKNEKYDAVFPIQPFGLMDKNNRYIQPQDVIYWISSNTKIPSLYTSAWQIKCGGTLAIAQRPSSQGILAADITLDLMRGKFPQAVVPPNGDIEINFAATQKLKIKIPFDLLTIANINKNIEVPCTPY